MSFQRILVPVDFSHTSEVAARFGQAIALETGGEVTLVHVQPLPGFATLSVEPIYVPPDVIERLQRAQHESLKARMEEFVASLGEGDRIHADFKRADVVEGIVRHAAETKTDLLVLGSHGVSAASILLGSTSLKVSQKAPCPVLIPRGEEPAPKGKFRHILVGVDYSRFSAPLAKAAAGLLAPGGTLELFHAWYEPFLSESALDMDLASEQFKLSEEGRATQARALETFARKLNLKEIDVHTSIENGKATGAILERAETVGADLIAVGAHAREGAVERVLGTVADRVLRHAPVPVLLLPAGAL